MGWLTKVRELPQTIPEDSELDEIAFALRGTHEWWLYDADKNVQLPLTNLIVRLVNEVQTLQRRLDKLEKPR
jgi:hypothetical protein